MQTAGSLRIRVGEYPDLISHLWTKCIQGDYNTRHKVRIRFRITGEIGFQFGLDYSPCSICGDSELTESLVSRWYYDTNGGFITVTIPDYDTEMYGREHYGVFSDGTFFISRQLVEHRQGKSVKLVTEQNAWKHEEMELVDNYFQFKINKNLSGRIR